MCASKKQIIHVMSCVLYPICQLDHWITIAKFDIVQKNAGS